jgi:hypothetical protein
LRVSSTEASDLSFPKLPEFPKEAIKAIGSSFPGKLLGRMAALLSLVLVLLGFAGAVDHDLKRFLGVDLSPTPWLHYGLLFGLPVLVVVAQLCVEWRAERVRRRLQSLAVQAAAVPQG